MSKAKAASAATLGTPSSGAHAAAKAATRRKSHPKFELPEVHTHSGTDWAFRDNAEAPHIAAMPTAADIAATTRKPAVQPARQEPEAKLSSPWAAPAFIAAAAMGSAALGIGMALLSTYAAVQFMTAPARIVRKLF